jgi:hypothetical protein
MPVDPRRLASIKVDKGGEIKYSSTGIDGHRWVSTAIDHHLAPPSTAIER